MLKYCPNIFKTKPNIPKYDFIPVSFQNSIVYLEQRLISFRPCLFHDAIFPVIVANFWQNKWETFCCVVSCCFWLFEPMNNHRAGFAPLVLIDRQKLYEKKSGVIK